ncbi:hypothetical protein JK359_11435 [Streptomyces actinomycinicus]|uniref:Uncharacterized protein n=2 Tax=Streptomyces actinomycinicus TaxID=1695166 RepID=A0A937JKJ4_9ACTN|nr:hypothetical protein [Streptomyces actinomycinicus]
MEQQHERELERERQDEDGTAAERAARRQREAERERVAVEPFDHPCPEHRAGGRARRRISEAAAVADTPPGIAWGYGATGGGQPGAGGTAHPPARSHRSTGDDVPAAQPTDDEERANHSER